MSQAFIGEGDEANSVGIAPTLNALTHYARKKQ